MTEQRTLNPRSRDTKLDAVKRMLAAQGAIGSQKVEGVPGPETDTPTAQAQAPVEASTQEPTSTPPPATEPAKAPKGGGEEGETAVKKRIDQLTARAKAAEERAAKAEQLESELAKLRTELSQAKREKLPDDIAAEAAKVKGFNEWPEPRQQAYVAALAAERVAAEQPELPAEMQQMMLHHKVRKLIPGNWTFEQVEVLADVYGRAPMLSPSQIELVAKDSHPDLFGQEERRAGLPASHVVQSPSSTGANGAAPPPRDEHGRFVEMARNARSRKEKQAAFLGAIKNWLGRPPSQA